MRKILIIFSLLLSGIIHSQGVVILGGGSTQQEISLAGNILSISGGGSVDLSYLLDNTDNQTVTDLSLSGDILSITLSGGNTKTVDLSTISGGSGISDGDKGDITVSGIGSAWTVDDNAINEAKIASSAVGSSEIINASILEEDIANEAVTSAKIADGSIGLADLSATGTASSSTYLRGDNTWATISSGPTLINSNDFTGATTSNVNSAAATQNYIDDQIASVSPTGINWETASTKTLSLSDAGKIFKNTGSTDYTYTIDTEASASYGEDIAFTFITYSTGKIYVQGEGGLTISPREISDVEKPATIIRDGENLWRWMGTTTAWTPTPTELYTRLSAVASGANETNAATSGLGFTVDDPTDGAWTSSATDTGSDAYMAVFTSSKTDADAYPKIQFEGLPTGVDLLVEVDAREEGNNAQVSFVTGNGWSASSGQQFTTSRATYSTVVQATVSNPTITIYDGSNVLGEKIYVYEVRISLN